MNLKEFIEEKITHYNKACEKNPNYYDRLRYKGIIETLKEIPSDATIEDLNVMRNKYEQEQKEYANAECFSNYHHTLFDRIYMIKRIIKFLEEMERNNENNI